MAHVAERAVGSRERSCRLVSAKPTTDGTAHAGGGDHVGDVICGKVGSGGTVSAPYGLGYPPGDAVVVAVQSGRIARVQLEVILSR